jgi:hypothetical protein
MSMTNVYEELLPQMSQNGKKVTFQVSRENYSEIVRFFVSLAIINYASVMFAKFRVPTGEFDPESEQELMAVFERTMSTEEHFQYAKKYYQTAYDIANKYSVYLDPPQP